MTDRRVPRFPSFEFAVALLVVLAVFALRRPAPVFLYDAAQYWNSASSLIHGQTETAAGSLDARGVLTAVVYLPAAAVSALLGDSVRVASWCVFGENAALIALLGVLILPRMLARKVGGGPCSALISSILSVVLLSGFAPYPLMDLPALTAFFSGLWLIGSRSRSVLFFAGTLLALGVNLRPAYLVSWALVTIAVLAAQRLRGLALLAGSAFPAATQVIFDRATSHIWSVFPPATSVINTIQLTYATYGVRYDTIAYSAGDPRRWYCDVDMAAAAHTTQALPSSNVGLLRFYLHHLPGSAVFALDKVAAALQWSWATPYAGAGDESLRALSVPAVAVAATGFVVLLAALVVGIPARLSVLSLLLAEVGCLVTIVGAAPEARFAAPLVAGGIATLARIDLPRGLAKVRLPLVFGAALAAALLLAGSIALAHPLPRGDITAHLCRAASTSPQSTDHR